MRAQAYTEPTPSSLQFPSPQNQNKMQALDKRYPHACGAGLSRREGVGESSGWRRTPQSISHRILYSPLACDRTQKVRVCVNLGSLQRPGKGVGGLLLRPLVGLLVLEGCPACSGLLLATRRVAGQAPGRSGSCVPGWWRSVRP